MPARSAYMKGMSELFRHIRACNNAVLPGHRLPVLLDGAQIGWTLPATAVEAASLGATERDGALHISAAALQDVARGLADRGLCRWRAEAFDVRATPDGPALGQIDRGALPALGIGAVGVHLNGLVGDRLWVARRAANKALDPGKLDHIVAGGVPFGHTIEQTLVKEAEEEAGMPPELASQARHTGTIDYAMDRAEGLRRDRLHCFDIEFPADFRPEPQDGEVEAFELWPLDQVLETVRRTDAFKFNVNLVLIDLFIRRHMLPPEEAASLRSALG